jgi:hypothetical protein
MKLPFGKTKTLTELEEDDDRLDTELSIAKKRAMIKQLEERGGEGSWRAFSSNGKKSGLDWKAIWHWLRTH